jgi:hypothetical protein
LLPLFDRPSAVPCPKSVGKPTHSKRFATKAGSFRRRVSNSSFRRLRCQGPFEFKLIVNALHAGQSGDFVSKMLSLLFVARFALQSDHSIFITAVTGASRSSRSWTRDRETPRLIGHGEWENILGKKLAGLVPDLGVKFIGSRA